MLILEPFPYRAISADISLSDIPSPREIPQILVWYEESHLSGVTTFDNMIELTNEDDQVASQGRNR
jgi:hypothetical protein